MHVHHLFCNTFTVNSYKQRNTVKSVVMEHALCFGTVTLINHISSLGTVLAQIMNVILQSIYLKLHGREKSKIFHNLSSHRRLQVREGLSNSTP